MLQRLQSAKSYHSVKYWKNHDAKSLYLKYNIMKNARRKEHVDYAKHGGLQSATRLNSRMNTGMPRI